MCEKEGNSSAQVQLGCQASSGGGVDSAPPLSPFCKERVAEKWLRKILLQGAALPTGILGKLQSHSCPGSPAPFSSSSLCPRAAPAILWHSQLSLLQDDTPSSFCRMARAPHKHTGMLTAVPSPSLPLPSAPGRHWCTRAMDCTRVRHRAGQMQAAPWPLCSAGKGGPLFPVQLP